MLELLKYATSDFWTFIFCFFIISVIGSFIVEIFNAIFKKSEIRIDLTDKKDKPDKTDKTDNKK